MCVELKWRTFLGPEQPFDPASCTVIYGATTEEGGVLEKELSLLSPMLKAFHFFYYLMFSAYL